MKEIWRSVRGFEGSYEVSNRGRVRSLDRWILCADAKRDDGSVRRGGWRQYKGQFLKPGEQMKSGHMSVAIGRGNSRLVHQLVLEAFVGRRPKGYDTLHLDHNPKNNCVGNLRYGTRSENIKMDYAAGKRKRWPKGRPSRWL